MNIGFIGLGKLGLPIAVAMSSKGHRVQGYDIDPTRQMGGDEGWWGVLLKGEHVWHAAWPDGAVIWNGTMEETCRDKGLIFVAVQTPHEDRFDGTHPLPEDRADFDYTFLKAAIQDIVANLNQPTPVVIISTVLPGTTRRELRPITVGTDATLIYNPAFAAMGTVIEDWLNPEFVLIGTEGGYDRDNESPALRTLIDFYQSTLYMGMKPMGKMWPIFQFTTIESAELAKVAYNTWISMKIGFANTVMDLCHQIPEADCDQVMDVLKAGDKRIVSPAYFSGGMGDGGACHPRDNIAMSWLAREHDIPFDMFGAVMECREKQAQSLAQVLTFHSHGRALPVAIYGLAYKAESPLTIGSAAMLVKNILDGECGPDPDLWDPIAEIGQELAGPAVILIGCNHARFASMIFPGGSVVIDPWRYIPDQGGVKVIRLGEAA